MPKKKTKKRKAPYEGKQTPTVRYGEQWISLKVESGVVRGNYPSGNVLEDRDTFENWVAFW
jgi:hypothetical protein